MSIDASDVAALLAAFIEISDVLLALQEGRGADRAPNGSTVKEDGRPPPPIDAVADYSGQLRLRLPKSLYEAVSHGYRWRWTPARRSRK